MNKPIAITSAEFEERVLRAQRPVLVSFTATWCGPCKLLSTVLDEVAGLVPDTEIFKLDVDEARDICMTYKVMSVPTLIVFSDGGAGERLSGYQGKDKVLALVGATPVVQ